MFVLHFQNAFLRDEDLVGARPGNDDRAGAAALQKSLRVGETGNDLDGTGGWVDNTAHFMDAPFLIEQAAVGELELDRGHLGYGIAHAACCLGHLQNVFLVHGEVYFHGTVVGNCR